jgi:hypothetical protein
MSQDTLNYACNLLTIRVDMLKIKLRTFYTDEHSTKY